jgi:hypothetical protein
MFGYSDLPDVSAGCSHHSIDDWDFHNSESRPTWNYSSTWDSSLISSHLSGDTRWHNPSMALE